MTEQLPCRRAKARISADFRPGLWAFVNSADGAGCAARLSRARVNRQDAPGLKRMGRGGSVTRMKRVCVYCGSLSGAAPAYREAAQKLGMLLAKAGIGLVYGGGRVGLMGILADAALKAGGEVTGVIPGHLHQREIGHKGAPRLIVVGRMHERKQTMFELADAFAILPGGLGTIEEAMEMITWRQLGLHDKPIFLIDVADYWAPFAALFDHGIAQDFARKDARALFRLLPRVEDLLPALAEAPPPAPAKPKLL
jgi:uncharacterized protein (TIGR00730 family)